jgi:secondary thiamine-phosphate synthase enzyme
MRQAVANLEIRTRRGLTDVTERLHEVVRGQKIRTGLCTVFIRHTSASLVIQENADPSARRDLERFLDRLVPNGDPLYEHTAEGDDDMPSHVKSALTHTSEQIPIQEGALVLGTWQGLYVWEHRDAPHRRELVVHVIGE